MCRPARPCWSARDRGHTDASICRATALCVTGLFETRRGSVVNARAYPLVVAIRVAHHVDGATVRVIANIDTLNNDTDFKPYVFTAQNAALTEWSGPVPLGFGPNYIDTFVMKDRGVYHAFAKNETTRFCEHAT